MNWKQLLSDDRHYLSTTTDKTSRSDFERDYDRLIFSYDFRRMQDKTQVLPFAESDFVHDRLTHSLETASIGRSLGRKIAKEILENEFKKEGLDYDMNDIANIVSTACLAHDIGNPPFGHNGEMSIRSFFKFNIGEKDKLNIYFKKKNEQTGEEYEELTDPQKNDFYLFEGNAQTFRLLTDYQRGLGLTFATLGASLKYPWESTKAAQMKKKKYGFFQSEKDKFVEMSNKLGLIKINNDPLEYCRHPLSYLVEAADDIAYTIVDLEDSIVLRFVFMHEKVSDVVQLEDEDKELSNLTLEDLILRIAKVDREDKKYQDLNKTNRKYAYLRAKLIGNVINYVSNVFCENYQKIMEGKFLGTLLDSCVICKEMKLLKNIAYSREYENKATLQIEIAGHHILGSLLKTLLDSRVFYDEEDSYKMIINKMFKTFSTIPGKSSKYEMIREVVDFVSGMTDSYALSCYQKSQGIKLPQMY